jgi:hypothetical protein
MLQVKEGKVLQKSTSPVEYFPLNERTGISDWRNQDPGERRDFGIAGQTEFTHNG